LAVRQFQRDNDIGIDGIVGPATSGALRAKLAIERAKEKAKNKAKETAGPAAITTGIGGGAAATIPQVVEHAHGLQSLSNSETFGLVVACLAVVSLFGFGAYWFISKREESKADRAL
ncbi:MAG: peptidoglycan-binding domain-containing protein, partial [Pseudomonadota bacterium]